MRSTILALMVAIGLAAPVRAANLCVNPGFETAESTFIFGSPGVPSVFGDWGGDLSQIVTAERDIVPYDGSRMLRFDATGNAADPALASAQVYQLVDVSAFAPLIASGSASATLSAWFNRVPGDSQTDTNFSASLYALGGLPSGFRSHLINSTYLSLQGIGLLSDVGTATWEPVSVTMPLPAGTTYLAVLLNATENVHNDGTAPEFDGHYADGISLAIVPEPATLMLVAAVWSLPALTRRRRAR